MESSIIKKLKNNLASNNNYIEEFWEKIKEVGTPIIEDIQGEEKYSLVTFLYEGDNSTKNVFIYGSVPGYRYSENVMENLENTNVFYKTYKVRNDVKFKYNFSINYDFDNDYKKIKKNSIIDHLNPKTVVFIKDEGDCHSEETTNSLVELKNVKKDYWTTHREKSHSGNIALKEVYSEELKENRRVWIYMPKCYEEGKEYKVLFLTDGFEYLNFMAAKEVLDNLIAEKKIEPIIGVFVASGKNRFEELTCNDTFSRFIVRELLPWVQENYSVSKAPEDNIIGGVSLGGLTAVYLALRNSQFFGKVLSQSGSFWFDSESLTREVEELKKLPIEFYLCAGILEDHPYDDEPIMMEVINRMRDTLISKGYKVHYENYPSGHDYLGWGETLATGLISLIGDEYGYKN